MLEINELDEQAQQLLRSGMQFGWMAEATTAPQISPETIADPREPTQGTTVPWSGTIVPDAVGPATDLNTLLNYLRKYIGEEPYPHDFTGSIYEEPYLHQEADSWSIRNEEAKKRLQELNRQIESRHGQTRGQLGKIDKILEDFINYYRSGSGKKEESSEAQIAPETIATTVPQMAPERVLSQILDVDAYPYDFTGSIYEEQEPPTTAITKPPTTAITKPSTTAITKPPISTVPREIGVKEILPTTAPIIPFPEIAVPEEIDVKKEIQKMIGGLPKTTEELAGKERPRIIDEPWYLRLLRGAAYGVQGRDFQEEMNKVQKRLDERFQQDVEVSRSALDKNLQLQLKQLDLSVQQREQKLEGMRNMWAQLAESNPNVKGDPGFWAMGAKVNHMPEEALKKWMEAHYNPETGKYENIYVPKHVREFESKMFLANELPKYLPGYPKEAYLFAAAFGTWPDMLKLAKEKYTNEFTSTTNPKRKSEIVKSLLELKKLEDLDLGLEDPGMIEISTLYKKGLITKGAYQDAITTKSLSSLIPKHAIPIFEALQKTRAAEATKETKTPTEGMLKFQGAVNALSTPTGAVMLEMNPGYQNMWTHVDLLNKFSEEYANYDRLIERITNWTLAGAKGKLWESTEQQNMAQDFLTYQKKTLKTRGYDKIANLLGSLSSTDATIVAQDAIKYAVGGVPEEQLVEWLQGIIKQRVPKK